MPRFTLPDPYDGWSEAKLKTRIRQLIRAVIRTERIVAVMVEHAPQGLEHLPKSDREKAKNLNAAYREGEIERH
jgi:hypothetical protein